MIIPQIPEMTAAQVTEWAMECALAQLWSKAEREETWAYPLP